MQNHAHIIVHSDALLLHLLQLYSFIHQGNTSMEKCQKYIVMYKLFLGVGDTRKVCFDIIPSTLVLLLLLLILYSEQH